MAKDMFWTVVTFGLIGLVLVLAFWPANKNTVVVRYDCQQVINGSASEVPSTVLEQCKRKQK